MTKAATRLAACADALDFTAEMLHKHNCRTVEELPEDARIAVRALLRNAARPLTENEMIEVDALAVGPQNNADYLVSLPDSAFGRTQ